MSIKENMLLAEFLGWKEQTDQTEDGSVHLELKRVFYIEIQTKNLYYFILIGIG